MLRNTISTLQHSLISSVAPFFLFLNKISLRTSLKQWLSCSFYKILEASTIYSQHICWNSQLIVCWNWFQFYGKPNDFLCSQIVLANVCNPTFIQYKTEQFTIHFLLCTFLSALLKSPPPWRVPLNHAHSRFFNTGISRSSLGSPAMQPLCSAPLTKAVDWNQLIACRHRFKFC